MNNAGPSVKISRGVLQGDPLPPYLFNVCLNRALSAISERVGVGFGEHRISYLAFADHVTLCASTRVGMQASLDSLTEGAMGLEVGVSKGATFGIRALGKQKTWIQDKNPFTIRDKRLRALPPGELYKYLGVRCGAEGGGSAHFLLEDLR